VGFDVLFVLVERLLTPWARAGGRRRGRGPGNGDAPADPTGLTAPDEEWVALGRANAAEGLL
jgi:hypothetical protein